MLDILTAEPEEEEEDEEEGDEEEEEEGDEDEEEEAEEEAEPKEVKSARHVAGPPEGFYFGKHEKIADRFNQYEIDNFMKLLEVRPFSSWKDRSVYHY